MAPRPTCPLPPSLSPILTYQVHTQTGTPTSLTSLLTTPQTLLIIIRHFYCSSCQDYIRALVSTPALTPSPSSPTKLIIIGCGSPDLIAGYASALNAPWDFYTDPSGALYDLLGLQKSLAMAETRPEYLEKPLFTAIWDGVVQAVRGGVLKGGNVLRVSLCDTYMEFQG